MLVASEPLIELPRDGGKAFMLYGLCSAIQAVLRKNRKQVGRSLSAYFPYAVSHSCRTQPGLTPKRLTTFNSNIPANLLSYPIWDGIDNILNALVDRNNKGV
jgi:hypothetical protein